MTPFPPTPEVTRMWDRDNETVRSWNGRVWRIRDLLKVVEDEPVFHLPLSLVPWADHDFKAADLFEFAQHMKHVMDSDPSEPVIMCERGRIIDGRHRLVRALLEGWEFVPCKKIPAGVLSSFTE